jgi:hypothetical protein
MLTHLNGCFGHGGGRQESRRSIGQVPGHVGGLGGEQATGRASFHRGGTPVDHEGELGDRGDRWFALQSVVSVTGEEHAFDEGLAGKIASDISQVAEDEDQLTMVLSGPGK